LRIRDYQSTGFNIPYKSINIVFNLVRNSGWLCLFRILSQAGSFEEATLTGSASK
jgi:hypothetical protein